MNVNRLIIKGKQEGHQIYLIGFEDELEQGFVANLENGLRWYPHSVHSIFGHSTTAGNHTTVQKTETSLSV